MCVQDKMTCLLIFVALTLEKKPAKPCTNIIRNSCSCSCII